MPMASIGRGPGGRDPTDMVKPLLNKTLVNILKEERLPHSGVKSAMQKRLADPSAGRNTVVLYLQLPVSVVDRLRHDPQLRVMLYCAADSGLGPFTKVDVAFPHQVELKVNGDEVKANLRGLKNRPGSTRPVDITGYLRKSGTYQNIIALSYAMTQKKFMYVVNLVKVHPVDELVNKLQNGRVISKSRVINDMVNKSRDLEIEETSEVIRIFTFEALVVDQYVNDILKSTDKSVDQVTIHPDGQWSQGVKSAPSPKPVSHGLSTSEDDDIVEIRSMPFSSPNGRNTPVANVTLSASSKSTNVGSREASYSSTPHRYPSSKRPIGKVIDLTTSDDDDEEPPRAAKRKAPVGTSIERETPNLQSIDAASGQDHRVNFRLPSVEASRPGPSRNLGQRLRVFVANSLKGISTGLAYAGVLDALEAMKFERHSISGDHQSIPGVLKVKGSEVTLQDLVGDYGRVNDIRTASG
ncbi:MAG: SUMO ligase siz1 [Piccolia ochrophora]|nr:MAG: SUMO ligase siz1 [Piccolia ochrophora]